MNCVDYLELIARDLEGALSASESRELHSHLSHCSRCRAELLLQRTLTEALRDAPPAELSLDFTARVVREALATTPEKPPLPIWPIAIATLSVLSAVASAVWGEQLRALLAAAPVRELFSPALTWMAEVAGRTSSWTSNLPTLDMPTIVPSLGALERLLAASLLSSVPLIWCFYQVYAFLRE